MKRRLEVLVGVLLASALTLGGCVAQTVDGDADDEVTAVGQARGALVGAPVGSDPTRGPTGSDPSNGSIAKSGPPGMSDPQPQPWKPPPSGPPADPGTPNPER